MLPPPPYVLITWKIGNRVLTEWPHEPRLSFLWLNIEKFEIWQSSSTFNSAGEGVLGGSGSCLAGIGLGSGSGSVSFSGSGLSPEESEPGSLLSQIDDRRLPVSSESRVLKKNISLKNSFCFLILLNFLRVNFWCIGENRYFQ